MQSSCGAPVVIMLLDDRCQTETRSERFGWFVRFCEDVWGSYEGFVLGRGFGRPTLERWEAVVRMPSTAAAAATTTTATAAPMGVVCLCGSCAESLLIDRTGHVSLVVLGTLSLTLALIGFCAQSRVTSIPSVLQLLKQRGDFSRGRQHEWLDFVHVTIAGDERIRGSDVVLVRRPPWGGLCR